MLVELSAMEQRYQAVLAVVQDGWKVVEVARRLGVSRQSVHTWIARYEAGGLAALIDRSHRPASCPHQIPGETEALICEMRREHPGWGPRRIEHHLGRSGVDPVPSRSSIYRCLRRRGLIELRRRRTRRDEFRRWERERPMQLWQMDVMGGGVLDDDTERKVVTGLDDHSRFCIAAGLVTATSKAVCAVLVGSLRRFGIRRERFLDAHDHHRGGDRVGWLLLAPIAALLLVVPPSLGSYGVGRAAAVDIRAGAPVFERLSNEGRPVAMTLLEFGQRAFERDGASFDGASVRLTGFVAGVEPGGFRLARYQIACCAADAAPVVIRVVGVHGGVPPLDGWVTITGRFEPGGGDIPLLAATDVTPIAPRTSPTSDQERSVASTRYPPNGGRKHPPRRRSGRRLALPKEGC